MIDRPAADFSVKPTLTGDRVVLRPFLLEQDAAVLREMLQDPESMRLTGSGHGAGDMPAWDDAAEAKFRDWYGTRNAQPDRLDLAVVDKASGQAVGEAVLNDWNGGNGSCNFRIMLGPRGRDRGLGTEATRLIVGYGFEQLGLHRIELQVYAFNPRARRVYEKAGFVAEGVLRHALRWDDEWVDATVMSMLATEWNQQHGQTGNRSAGGGLAGTDETPGLVDVELRRLTPAGVGPGLLAVLDHPGRRSSDPGRCLARAREHAAREDRWIMVAYAGGQPAGMAEAQDYGTCVRRDFGVVRLHELFVIPGRRRLGIGRLLVQAALRWAAGRPDPGFVEWQASRPAVVFYESLGFTADYVSDVPEYPYFVVDVREPPSQ